MDIESEIASWLRYKRQCPVVAFECETSANLSGGRADVVGITQDRRLIEVEVKRSVSDFRADSKKRKWDERLEHYIVRPAYFYYAAPTDVAQTIRTEVKDGFGLLSVEPWVFSAVVSLVPCRRLHDNRLTIKQALRIVFSQSATLARLSSTVARMIRERELSMATEKEGKR